MLGSRQRMVVSGQRREFDLLRPCALLEVRPARSEEVPALVAQAAGEIAMLEAFADVVGRVHRHNRRVVLAITQREVAIGAIAVLPLNGRGLEALLSAEFAFDNPDLDLICREQEAPAGIYVWSICATGRAAAAFGNIVEWLQRDGWHRANVYGKPSTPDGARLMNHGGFRPFRSAQGDLWRYRRLLDAGATAPAAA